MQFFTSSMAMDYTTAYFNCFSSFHDSYLNLKTASNNISWNNMKSARCVCKILVINGVERKNILRADTTLIKVQQYYLHRYKLKPGFTNVE